MATQPGIHPFSVYADMEALELVATQPASSVAFEGVILEDPELPELRIGHFYMFPPVEDPAVIARIQENHRLELRERKTELYGKTCTKFIVWLDTGVPVDQTLKQVDATVGEFSHTLSAIQGLLPGPSWTQVERLFRKV